MRARWLLALMGTFLFTSVVGSASAPSDSSAGPVGPYKRVVLVSWDGVQRDMLEHLLDYTEVDENGNPALCWAKGNPPTPTGETDEDGNPLYTCLPTLKGLIPVGEDASGPEFAPFDIIGSHATDTGKTLTLPQHTSLLTGYSPEVTGIEVNASKTRLPEGMTVYERLMNVFDPPDALGERTNEFVFRTSHSASKKYVGRQITRAARKSGAIQRVTGRGGEKGRRPGPLKHAEKIFRDFEEDAAELGTAFPSFFSFLHFKRADWDGHLSGAGSRAYRAGIVANDWRLYLLLQMLKDHGWQDTGLIITTDHGFSGGLHHRAAGRQVFNTWIATNNVPLSTGSIPVRTQDDYCASHADPDACLADPESHVMPARDAIPNVCVTDLVPTLLEMFGIDPSAPDPVNPDMPALEGRSLLVRE